MGNRSLSLALLLAASSLVGLACAPRTASNCESVRVVFDPSFHRTLYVTASAHPSPHITLSTPTDDEAERRFRNGIALRPGFAWGSLPKVPDRPPGPGWHVATIAVTDARWKAFSDELARAEPLTLGDSVVPDLSDGMVIGAEYRGASGRANVFVYDGYEPSARHERFLLAISRLTIEHTRDAATRDAVRFLNPELPGPPSDLPIPPLVPRRSDRTPTPATTSAAAR